MSNFINKIRSGEIDCNNSQLFFPTLLKALLLQLKSDITIRGYEVPHVIVNTGDDTMWLMLKDYDYSKEPFENTNEQYVYNITPRCIVTPKNLDTMPDQLTNPYSRGQFQMEYEDRLYTLSAEMRRMPVKFTVELEYNVDSFRDLMELVQHIISKLSYIRTYKFVYLGQTIQASYKMPESFDNEHLVDMDGTTQDSKDKKITFSLEVESTFPLFSQSTVQDASVVVAKPAQHSLSIGNKKVYEKDPYNEGKYKGYNR